MPITIAGSGTITGISAGGLPDDSIIAADIAAGAVTTAKVADANITAAKLDGAQSGSAPIYGARAWVNFNASSGTPTIRSSGNVSSLTDEALGKFTINFSTVLPDANYSVIATTGNTGSTSNTGFCGPFLATSTSYQSKTTSSVYMGILAGNNAALLDLFDVNVAIFR